MKLKNRRRHKKNPRGRGTSTFRSVRRFAVESGLRYVCIIFGCLLLVVVVLVDED